MLNAAGWQERGADGIRTKDGKRLSFEFLYIYKAYEDRAVVLKEEAKKAGIELKLKQLDPSTGWKYIQDKKSELTMMGWATRDFPQYWEGYHSANANKKQTNNLTNTSDPKLDKQIEEYRATTDLKRRYELAPYHPAVCPRRCGGRYRPFLIPYYRFAHWWQVKFSRNPNHQNF